MAEFLRKKRFLKYNDSRCKKFLSKDFNRKCAYCKIREGDLAGPESFEKDHFFPIAKGGKDDYENLYYSCVSCNGKAGKSDTSWILGNVTRIPRHELPQTLDFSDFLPLFT